MLKKYKVNTLLLFFLTIQIGVFGQEKDRPNNQVRARIIDSKDKRVVSFARVINKSKHIGVYSDTLGVFTIQAYHNDTLLISAIGYFPSSIIASDSLYKQTKIPKITLQEHVYELGMIDINSFGTYQQFRYKVLHLQLQVDNTTQNVIESIQREIALIPKHPLKAEASISLGSPVTALYDLFSKEGKMKRHFNKVIETEKANFEDEKSMAIIREKYNQEVVSRATGLTGDLLKQFMLYCKPENRFIVLSDDYDLYKQILDCYADFKRNVIENKLLSNQQ